MLFNKIGRKLVLVLVIVFAIFGTSTSAFAYEQPFYINITLPETNNSTPVICNHCDGTMLVTFNMSTSRPVMLYAGYDYRVWSIDQQKFLYTSGWYQLSDDNPEHTIVIRDLPVNERLQIILGVTGYDGNQIHYIQQASGSFISTP
ncbi:hypothetical protein H8B09_04760 [Paenibacillus sp. PR3]|uniref:Secreted protein n=1 Tax=Paenibacillus terricola TaxID=2763503 RepID=A0ABR8MPY4_9BACL|nr:hypothetical protein [Paenibacillus terricola]MBD3918054.1 hypothetical protein [Paenibacillus terricola]